MLTEKVGIIFISNKLFAPPGFNLAEITGEPHLAF
jgi:hypothetical protein